MDDGKSTIESGIGMTPKHRALICLLVSAGLLTGCSPAQNTALALHPPISPFTTLVLVDGISVINTKKTVEDHVISWVSGQDCSLVRASKGGDYCVNDTPVPTEPRAAYCYKSIAAVTCYERLLASDQTRYYGTRVDMVPVRTQ